MPEVWFENEVGCFLEHFPTRNELVFAALDGKVLVELTLKDVSVCQRESTVVQSREDPERGVLGFRLDGKQDYVIENASGE